MSGLFCIAVIPSIGWIITALGIYAVVATPLVFWGLLRTGKRGLAWVALPVVSAIATSGLWLYAHQQVHP